MERAQQRYDRFIITRRGRAEAVLLASDEFEGLLETLEVLSDQAQVERLIAAEEELEAGGGFGLDAIRAELERGDD